MLRHVSFFYDRFPEADCLLFFMELTISTKRSLKRDLNQRKSVLLNTRQVIGKSKGLLLRDVYIIRGSYAIGREPAAGLRCAAIDRGFLNHFWTWMQIMKEEKEKLVMRIHDFLLTK